jgi:hypothetical protein
VFKQIAFYVTLFSELAFVAAFILGLVLAGFCSEGGDLFLFHG